MNAATDPTPPGVLTAPPTLLYPAPPMVPVDFTRLDPLPPPPTKENAALIRAGTIIATFGSVALVVSLFVVPWFFVREISVVQPAAGRASAGNNTGQTSVNSFAPRIAQRDLHDFGLVAWASSRREKRDVAIVALALLTQASVLISSASFRWRLLLFLAGCGALAVLILTLIDYRGIGGLIRERITLGSSFGSNVNLGADVLKISGERPGTGMIVLLVGAAGVLLGSGIALIGGRRGKVLAPVPQ
ncbi:MAG: hypothetical protein ACYDAR_09600 [Thermomicrobiales bacterium]